MASASALSVPSFSLELASSQADDADEMAGEAAGVDLGAASSAAGASGPSGTEEPTSSTTELDRGVGSRQTNLKGWLKGAP